MRLDLEGVSSSDTAVDINEAIKGMLFRLKSFSSIYRMLVYRPGNGHSSCEPVSHSGSGILNEVVVISLWDNWEAIFTQ